MKKRKIILFYGTRPEYIKLYPVIKILRLNENFALTVVNTGQHKEMLLSLENFFCCKADLYMDLMTPNQNLNQLLSSILLACIDLFNELNPESIIVQGDTTTVFGAATAAFYQGIKVYHVEAGLRSMDIYSPFPEEFNRRSVSLISNIHFAPTQLAVNNLIAEGINKNSIVMTGNTVIDTLKEVKKLLIGNENQNDSRQIFITAHRRENHKEGIESICRAVLKLLALRNDIVFKWAVHPNPNVKDTVFQFLGNNERVILTEPLNYLDLLQELNNSYIIWTDSGGIQEEAPEFNKPVLILREETERPEIIDCGLGLLVGVNENKIIKETTKLLDDKLLYISKKSIQNPFGEGNASIRILEKLMEVK
jgi:UDP-N-acetylglucosamine 2-epimerase (non-hydrolysing)